MRNFKLIWTLAGVMILSSFALFSQKSIDLKYNVQKGDQYNYSINLDQDVSFQTNGQTMALNQKMMFVTTSTITEANKDSLTMKTSIDRIKMTQGIFGMEITYDSDDSTTLQNPMAAKIAESMSGMIDKSYIQVMDSRGNILRTDMSDLTSEDVANNLNSGAQFGIYPDHPVKVGDSWETDITPLKGSDMKVHGKYTLMKISGHEATIRFEGTLSANNVQDMDMKLSGTQNGQMKVNVKTGWLIESTIDQEMKLDMEQNGQKFPATISGTIITKSSKTN